jgi:hypothetical protein
MSGGRCKKKKTLQRRDPVVRAIHKQQGSQVTGSAQLEIQSLERAISAVAAPTATMAALRRGIIERSGRF